MGCDIHTFVEKRNKKTKEWELVGDHFSMDEWDKSYYGKEKTNRPFRWRQYSMFGFLADVRNYEKCEPISEPRGIPSDTCDEIKLVLYEWGSDAHSESYLTAKELLEFDYDKHYWNRRITKTETSANGNTFINGAALAENINEGSIVTYREMLDPMFFVHLEELEALGDPEDVRLIFWFDN